MSTEKYHYDVPVDPFAPWPTFRRDRRNTGRSPIRGDYADDKPWNFRTEKGVFSTPVIDGAGTIFFGSADHGFFALGRNGRVRWKFETGEIIDSAGALLPPEDEKYPASVLVPSGDGYLYRLACDTGKMLWKFDARTAPRASYNNWFEANVALGSDGTIYAGNTNFNYYAIDQDAGLKWTYPTGANAWSCAGIGNDGAIYWGSNDTFVHAVQPDGSLLWKRRTLGFIAASAAVGTDGTVYIGSYDSRLYALNPKNGRVKWKFKTQDHIYGSAALGISKDGETDCVFVGSTDGSMYAVSTSGELLWRYDAGAPIRSSAVLGRTPQSEDGWIVYFGCGNGKLYALNAADGSRRWSYDTRPEGDEEADRYDLNGSPALGKTGAVIGGEHGRVWYVPYDYPLHHNDPRGCIDPGEDLPRTMAGLYYVTPGGNVCDEVPETLPAATMITLRLVVRQNSETVDARLYNVPFLKPGKALNVQLDPPAPFSAETSADGRYLHIIPQGYLTPGQTITIKVQGNTYTGGLHIGNLTLGGKRLGRFEETLAFTVEKNQADRVPLTVAEEQVSAFEWTRLSVPIPTMLPSLNQIGFDYMDWIIGLVGIAEPDVKNQGRMILWAVGGHRDEAGELVCDPETDFVLPLSGTYQQDSFIVTNRQFTMPVTGIPIPFNRFELRGRMGKDMRVSGATAMADTKVLGIPTFGPLLVIAGLASNWWEKLLVMATYVTRSYSGPSNKKPQGIRVESVQFVPPTGRKDGSLKAAFVCEEGFNYPAEKHHSGIVLVDNDRMEALPLDYLHLLKSTEDTRGNLKEVSLSIPANMEIPPGTSAVVMLDVYPAWSEELNCPH